MKEVYRSGSLADCDQRVLVLEAFDIASMTVSDNGDFIVLVAEENASRALTQLQSFEKESQVSVPMASTVYLHAHAWVGALLYAAVLIIVAYCAGVNLTGADWRLQGALTGTLSQTGEWWRLVTSMTLHADIAHLLSNAIIGAVFGYFAGQLLGPGIAWLSIVAAGTVGGLADALVMPMTQKTIGASGAVFAMLGIVAAYSWRLRAVPRLRWVQRWAPLTAGVVILGLIGTGGENTDVLAHITGFVSGILLGVLYTRLRPHRLADPWVQLGTGTLALGIIVVAWMFALR